MQYICSSCTNKISKYSHFEISAEQKDMLEDPSMDLLTDMKGLEDTNFLQPVSYFECLARARGIRRLQGQGIRIHRQI